MFFCLITLNTGHQNEYKRNELIRTPAAVSSPRNPIYLNRLLLIFKSCMDLFMSATDWIDWMGKADPD